MREKFSYHAHRGTSAGECIIGRAKLNDALWSSISTSHNEDSLMSLKLFCYGQVY